MPDRTNADLPPPVRSHLPPHAQDIYREASNHVFASYAGDERQEEIAHRTAWSAVKRSYVKLGDSWVPLHTGTRKRDPLAGSGLRSATTIVARWRSSLASTFTPFQF
jgi:cation transport regulator